MQKLESQPQTSPVNELRSGPGEKETDRISGPDVMYNYTFTHHKIRKDTESHWILVTI